MLEEYQQHLHLHSSFCVCVTSDPVRAYSEERGCSELEMLRRVFQSRLNLFNLWLFVINAPTLPVVGITVPRRVVHVKAKCNSLPVWVCQSDLQCIISCLCSSCESSMV